ncbi:MAG TPA: adenylosuccinate synthetase, partial [Bacteroidales bacterium]|nr:adenylosuccinate synthetase [Bacteroidales bacterium]
VFGIVKAYCTRVGSGPFPTELMDATGQLLRDTGREYGSTTGRPRRCGWLDLPALRYAVMLNGVTRLFLMKTDVLNAFPEISVCTAYSMNGSHSTEIPYDLGTPGLQPVYQQLEGWQQEIHTPKPGESLPDALDRYIRFIEEATGVPVAVVSIGPDREETIVRHNFVNLRA